VTYSERALHERVARRESHEAQTRGIVGLFYRTYVRATREFLTQHPGAAVLDVGCGEGILLRGSGFTPIQLDISVKRLRRVRAGCNVLICSDGMELPFADASFDVVLLVALLEHVSRPERVMEEAWRVLKPGGEVAIVVPNDVWMSLGRLLLLRWPPRYPDNLSWVSPRRIRRMAEGRFAVQTAFALPIRWLPFALNMYYWTVLRKLQKGRTELP